MYLQHFGLSEFPFSTSPDPRYYYPTPKHREALACLLYTVQQKKGFALVTGEVGAGKTMLCHAALRRFGEAVEAASLSHTSLTADELLQAIAAEFGTPPATGSKVDIIAALKRHLMGLREAGRTAVLIVDEAQDLRLDVLEEIRLLGNLETPTEKLLQVLLVGQPELRGLIGSRQLQPLDQRIAVKFHLGPLPPEEVSGYVDHRLDVAGASRPLFNDEAKALVADASGGVPRLINVICDQALLQAYVEESDAAGPETVRRVVAEMEGYYMDAPGGEDWDDTGGSLAEASRARGAPMGVPLRPAVPEPSRPATPQFEDVEVLCDAIEGGWLALEFGTPNRGRQVARYLVDGAEIALKLARGSTRDYVALVATAPRTNDGHGVPPPVELAEQMSYTKVAEGVYRRKEGELAYVLRLGNGQIGVACSAAGHNAAGAVARHVRKLHGELAQFEEVRSALTLFGSTGGPEATTGQPSRGGPLRKATMKCPGCGTEVGVFEDEVGEQGKCPGCGSTIRVPANLFAEG